MRVRLDGGREHDGTEGSEKGKILSFIQNSSSSSASAGKEVANSTGQCNGATFNCNSYEDFFFFSSFMLCYEVKDRREVRICMFCEAKNCSPVYKSLTCSVSESQDSQQEDFTTAARKKDHRFFLLLHLKGNTHTQPCITPRNNNITLLNVCNIIIIMSSMQGT